MSDEERDQKLEAIALRMYIAGAGWNLDALKRLVDPPRAWPSAPRMPEPTPFERGVLDRYQPKRRRNRNAR